MSHGGCDLVSTVTMQIEVGGIVVQITKGRVFDGGGTFGHLGTKIKIVEKTIVPVHIKMSDVVLKTMLRGHEHSITGEERRKRLAADGYVSLTTETALTLFLEHREMIPSSWKRVKAVHFDGNEVEIDSHRCHLCLYWSVCNWHLGHGHASSRLNAGHPSAVIKSSIT